MSKLPRLLPYSRHLSVSLKSSPRLPGVVVGTARQLSCFVVRSAGRWSTMSETAGSDKGRRDNRHAGDGQGSPVAQVRHYPGTHRSSPGEEGLKARKRFLEISLEEKRLVYKCRDNYKTLNDVPTWPQYRKEHNIGLRIKPKADPNEKFNEKVSLWRGDITQLEIDAIANAANESLLGGGGVDGAIHSAAGPTLVKETSTLGGCETGHAKLSGGHRLPAKYVLHAVGPIGQKPDKLEGCYKDCMALAKEHGLRSVAFPCISTGIFGYPNYPAGQVAIGYIRKWLETGDNADHMDRVIFCVFLEKDVQVYEELLPAFFPTEDDVKGDKEASGETEAKETAAEEEPKKGSSEGVKSEDTAPEPMVAEPEEVKTSEEEKQDSELSEKSEAAAAAAP
ncbi:PREDICTED: O-acetyl-ADP-ribose deacetylase MACROD1-like isoform X2 [Branchiostoma belcheri]|uniref:O-acetyl-ADP-ribose deacetylase MACROD1-like isoform X2 n=1 Tax=Branchiostoma belcheri TaxID=7741 RepID=A0A6P5A369_BRABE|nr:PREDICTED: O-acetyl-ADP-ribose deacetylase MACROD1-like isoform X2 [Branchiostoma belcheri]